MSNSLIQGQYGRIWQLGLGAIASCLALGNAPLLARPAPPASLATVAVEPAEPPSPFWLLAMPLLPLAGGGLTYLVRRAQAKAPFPKAGSDPKPPDRAA